MSRFYNDVAFIQVTRIETDERLLKLTHKDNAEINTLPSRSLEIMDATLLSEYILSGCKYLGIAVSSVSGVVAIYNETRGPTTQKHARQQQSLNKSGRISLLLVVAGSILAFGAQFIDDLQRRAQDAELHNRTLREIAATRTTISNLRTIILSLSPVGLHSTVTFSFTNTELRSELKWIDEIPRSDSGFRQAISKLPGIWSEEWAGTNIIRASLQCDSSYHPVQRPGSLLYEFLNNLSVSLEVRAPKDSTHAIVLSGSDAFERFKSAHDATFWRNSSFTEPNPTDLWVTPIVIDLHNRTLSIGLNQSFDESTLRLSSSNLQGAVLIFTPRLTVDGEASKHSTILDDILKSVRLNIEEVNIADSRFILRDYDKEASGSFSVLGNPWSSFYLLQNKIVTGPK